MGDQSPLSDIMIMVSLCLLLIPGALFTPASSKLGLSSCFRDNVAYDLGQAIASKTSGNVTSCQRWCQAVYPCSHWAYSRITSMCYLRQGDKEVPMAGYVSGPKFCPRRPASDKPQSVCSAGLCLQGGQYHQEGNVLVDGKPVCDDNWGLRNAVVVCGQLGYPGVEAATTESQFGLVEGDFSLENVSCVGNETMLTDCEHKKQNTCFSHEAAGVICAREAVTLAPGCEEADTLCLVGGHTEASGNVYLAGRPVCHNGWDYADANVVCRSLGYIGALDFTLRSHFGPSATWLEFSDVDCRGDEASLRECSKSRDTRGCSTRNVAGVHCTPIKAELSALGDQRGLVVSLTVLLSSALVVIILLSLYIARHRIARIRPSYKMEMFDLPSKSDILRSRTRVSVEDLVGADFNQLYQHTDKDPKS